MEKSARFAGLVDDRLESAATLPSWCYGDPAVLGREMTLVFGTTWQLVGRAEQVAAPGQYFTASVGEEPMLVARGQDGRLRALSNVCRHRAGPVAQGAGAARALRCGYHGWGYGLDGSLLSTPEFEGVEGFRKEGVCLPGFAVDTWIGLVFVNLDSSAPPLRESFGELAHRLDSRRLDRMRLAFHRDWTLDCNWKVYVDNYLEGYHIPVVHPALMRELDYARYRTETSGIVSRQHAPARKDAPGKLRVHDGETEEAEYYWIYPNLMLNVYPDNYSTNLILPLGPDRTHTVFEWFFDDPDAPGVSALVEQTVDFSDQVQREDIAICEAVQRGLRSRTYDRGRYSVKRENGVHHFHTLYAKAMESGPAELLGL